MAKLVWTNESIRWLKEIDEHIAKENPAAAAKVVEGIYDKVQLLASHVRLGFRYLPIQDREIRVLLYGHYRVFYEVVTDEHLTVLGVFHAALDIEKYL